MIVVLPPSFRHEDSIAPTYYEDHLLERVSLLELRMSQLTEQLVLAYEFIQREANSNQKDHALIESFFESLDQVNPDLSADVNRSRAEIAHRKLDGIARKKSGEIVFESISRFEGSGQSELFAHLVKEGVRLLDDGEEKQAFQTLERAVLLSAKNIPLLVFFGKSLFKADKFERSMSFLERAFELEPQHLETLVLLGILHADAREPDKARKLLSLVSNFQVAHSFADLIWGILAASEGNWLESLAAFRESLSTNDSPEIHYLIGCVYFQLGNESLALAHLENAVLRDPQYADAWFMKSVVYEATNMEKLANETRIAASGAREQGAQCVKFLSKREKTFLEVSLPFQHFNDPAKRLISGGARRLNLFVQEEIQKIIG